MATPPDRDDPEADVTEGTAPADRAVILVASDERYAEMVRAVDWTRAGPALLAAIPAFPMLGPLTTGSLVASALARRSTRIREGVRAVQGTVDRVFRRGEIPLPRVLPAAAASLFRFPSGEPRDGTAYLIHPHDPGRYLLPASSAVELGRERMALFSTVAASLGARRIVLAHAETRSSRRGADGGIPLPKLAMELGVTLQSGGTSTTGVWREYAAPTAALAFPEEHRAAIERDPELSSLVRERLDARLLSSRVRLRVAESDEATTRLGLLLAKKGVRVGASGSSVTTAESSFVFDVEFWP